MKRLLLIVALLATAMLANSQSMIVIDNQKPQNSSVQIIEENGSGITLKLNVNSYSLSEVQTPNGTEVIVGSPDGINYMEKGIPDVPYFATSVSIPSKGKAIAEIVDANYITVNNISIAPSKGSISRKIDPATVPYEYGKCYSTDAFVPSTEAVNSEAFCIRDVRGTTVHFFPFQYNPVQKQLKVFTEITVKVKFTQQPSENEITASYEKIDEFENIYRRLFINYGSKTRYTQLQDGHPGRMLIICKDSYQSAMPDFIAWKREKGIETEMVLMSAIGTTAANVQTYITNYFNNHSDLAYILLVGDAADVPSNVSTSGSGWSSETKTSDNQYAYLVGNDHYADVFIGRFSGQSVADVQNMVRKVILYEKELTTSDSWLTNGYGSASNEGGGSSGGHNQGNGNESDMTHMGYIQTDLENYGYTVTRVNQASSGYTSDVAATSAAFNAGVGLACYIGHGDTQEWASTGYKNSHVNALTNANKYPFIISVACVNGDFNGNTCFAEAWLRASKNGNPTGALAFLGSTINQDWDPPMTAQDEMIDIITESLNGNIKRTIGGITFNGYFRMIQDYPANSSSGDGVNTADAWLIFGDPSTMFRSKTPQEMTITHPSILTVGQPSIDVSSNADETLIAITREIDGEVVILGAGYANNGSATIDLVAINEPCTVKITATAYNKVTYQSEIMVIVPEGPYIVNGGYTINDSEGNNNGIADYNETIKLNYTLNNVGVETANNANMTISSSSNDITITDNNESFGNIAANGSATQNNAFSMSIRNGVPDQTNIEVAYAITADNCDTRNGSFILTANAPAPAMSFVRINDSENGNNNNLLDAGETAKIIFSIANNGHAQLNAGTATLSVNAEGITLISNEAQYNAINAGSSQNIEFEIAVAEEIASATIVCFTAQTNGTYNTYISTYLSIGLQIEDWESNSFDSYEWDNSSSVPWTIVSTGAYAGQYCAKSGNIGDNANTDLTITLDVINADNVEFYKKVSCEDPGSGGWWSSGTSYYDYLAFYIDGNEKEKWASSNDNWSLQTYPVTAGTHTLKWSYVKDVNTTGGSDCAWIDEIKLPVHAKSIVNIHTYINVAENTMDIYPNPASDNAYINLNLTDNSEVSICIYNTAGQMVKTIDINLQSGENYVAVETSEFKSGMYIVKANIGNSVITKNLSIVK
ncbi:MAG: T9SS type A sorting domain-containing protein [Bacteroidales bacterium]|nr:T9SS type A sorting domain-containing protein [Bacteroidales bacterium]